MPYRVVQWATGAVGRESFRGILAPPALEMVGVRAYSDDKHGVDAGLLVDRDPVGVAATTDVDEVPAGAVDCVLYTPRTPSVQAHVVTLASFVRDVPLSDHVQSASVA